MAVIELDLYTPPGPERRRLGPRLERYRYAALAVALLLVLTLGGAARPESVLWRPAGSAPMTPEGTFMLAGGRLYAFDLHNTTLTTTAWSLGPARRLWSRENRALGAGRDPRGLGWYVVATADDGVLLQADLDATVLDARTGAVRWHRSALITPLPGRYGLIFDETYRPDSEYGEDNVTAGPVFYGTDGVFHVEPPIRTELRVLDMRTGEQMWTARYTGRVIAAVAPGNPAELLVYAQDTIALRAARTGATRLSRSLHTSPAAEWMYTQPIIGDVVLIAGPRSVTAYSARTLRPLWDRPRSANPAADSWSCVDVLCEHGNVDTLLLDPATGRPRWRLDSLATVRAAGADLYVMDESQRQVVEVRDAATGALRADLRRWEWTAEPQEAAPLVVSRPDHGRSVFAVVRPDGAVQPLGISDTPVTECRNDVRHVVCRVNTGVLAWAYDS